MRDDTRATAPHLDLTDDAFLGGALRILQPRKAYRAGLDAVMLAAAVPEGARTVLDVGAGVGTAGLCVARRLGTLEVALIERAPELAALARENVTRNGLADRVRVAEADIHAPAADLAAAGLRPDSFDVVIANPPFHATARGTPAAHDLKAGAHAMDAADLDDWARFLARMCAPGGLAILVHKAEALGQVLTALERRFGSIAVLPLLPRAGAPAHRILVAGRKGSRAPLTLLAPLVLHGDGHAFTPEADAILRHGAALALP